MKILEDFCYHVYNQSNNGVKVFLDDEDYSYFLNRAKVWIAEKADVLAYCIMPNHFHFLIHANAKSSEIVRIGSLNLNGVSNGFRLLQSQYAQYFNRKYGKSGSVFRPKIKWKLLNSSSGEYVTNCFNYIHNNPLEASLSANLEGWKHSSYLEYCGLKTQLLVDKQLAKQYVKADWEDFDL
ncbi:transposase [Roseivirga spongicola]|uniref:transposase n=1 Tax=Roseivirga spongicola TaxID=333140 RepID=UPI002AC93DF7|nr:transposase [Roseivirga spongicola]WPZ10830.1 transposase [Roseivirga spongicola]